MAFVPYLVLSPTSILSMIGFLYGRDRTIPTPAEEWRKATVDLVIPSHNESKNIVFCLNSIRQQTLQPNKIYLIDDGSTDNTSEIAESYKNFVDLGNIEIIKKSLSHGKTPIVSYAAKDSQADVLFVLDADTQLVSETYIERLVQELFQGVGIACACGVILPIFPQDRLKFLNDPINQEYANKYPAVLEGMMDKSRNSWKQAISNNYRAELYLFLQRYIYLGEMVFFGTIINPVGCAVAYRRKYLLNILDYYHKQLGHNLTTSEDIFIGFAFASQGYRNIQVQGVYGLTVEPPVSKLPHQIFLWSSAYLQSCYYFKDLILTPLKYPSLLIKKIREKITGVAKKIKEKRKIKEAYRQAFGENITHKYGRPIGWFMFTSLLEKITFPIIIIVMMVFHLWGVLAITFVAEVIVFSSIIAFMHKNKRIKNFFKSVLIAPIRYTVLVYDLLVFSNFVKDIIIGNRRWRK